MLDETLNLGRWWAETIAAMLAPGRSVCKSIFVVVVFALAVIAVVAVVIMAEGVVVIDIMRC